MIGEIIRVIGILFLIYLVGEVVWFFIQRWRS